MKALDGLPLGLGDGFGEAVQVFAGDGHGSAVPQVIVPPSRRWLTGDELREMCLRTLHSALTPVLDDQDRPRPVRS